MPDLVRENSTHSSQTDAGQADPAMRSHTWLSMPRVDRWALAIGSALTAAILRQLMFYTPALRQLGERTPFSFAYLAITFAALAGGWGPGLLAMVVSLLIEGLRLNGPPFPQWPHPSEFLRLGLFAAIDLVIISVCARVQRVRTELEAALGERQLAEGRARGILESITDAFYSLDADWRYTYVNHQCEVYLGKSRNELVGRVIWEVFPQLLGSEVEETYRRVMRQQKTERIEVKSPISKLWVEGYVYPSPEGLSVYFHNVTERRKSQEALRQSEERYRLLVDTAQEGIWMLKEDSTTSYVNQAMGDLLGYAPPELIGRKMCEFLDDASRHRVEGLEADRKNGVAARQDLRFKRKDGTAFDAHVSENPILGPGGEYLGTLALVIDVTTRRAAEAERADLLVREQRARAEAEAAIRRKDQFLAVLSHELRTPLTPVLARLALMRREQNVSASMKSGLEMIRRNVELEARLIDDLLDVTRLARGQMKLRLETVDAHEQLRAALAIYEADVATRRQTVAIELHAENPLVKADAVRLEQVFWNLLGNAVKYTPEGGTITLRSQNIGDRTGKLRVQVSDNGIGITPEVMPRLFDPFEQGEQTLTRRYGGLGLGLSISRTLVQMQGGTLTAESAGRGAGATFTVELPTVDVPDAAREVSPEIASRPSQGVDAPPAKDNGVPAAPAVRILLVDDNEDTLRVMARLLKLNGHHVVTANNVASALAAAVHRFDLLITDIGLPDGTGWDLMQQLKAKRPVRGIAISGFTMEEDVRRSHEAGFSDHLSKPLSPGDLDAAISRAMAGSPVGA